MVTLRRFWHTHSSSARRVATGVLITLIGVGLSACARDKEEPTAPSDRAFSFNVRATQADLDSALAVHRRHTMQLIEIPGVVGTAVGLTTDGRPAISIFTNRTGIIGLPINLEGIPVEVRVTGEIVAHPLQETGTATTCSVNCTTVSQWPLPVPTGVSTGPQAFILGQCPSGTIGARVSDFGRMGVYALSNNHVLALENTVAVGTDVRQPGLHDTPACSGSGSSVIGTLSAFKTIAFCSGGSCTENTIDAAIALSDPTRLDNWTAPEGYGVPNSVTRAASLGLSVQKYGRTSGLTRGQITGIDATVDVGYASGIARFVHQVVISSCPGPGAVCIRPGDSGSLLVTNDATRNPVGLLFAGNQPGTISYANPIDSVLMHFGVKVDASPAPTASGGAPASCQFDWCSEIIGITASGGNTITFHRAGLPTATLTLSGATASGGVPPCGGETCSPIVGITASGGNTITLHRVGFAPATLTLSGAKASGGLSPVCGAEYCQSIIAVTATGTNWVTMTNQAGSNDKGYLKLSF